MHTTVNPRKSGSIHTIAPVHLVSRARPSDHRVDAPLHAGSEAVPPNGPTVSDEQMGTSRQLAGSWLIDRGVLRRPSGSAIEIALGQREAHLLADVVFAWARRPRRGARCPARLPCAPETRETVAVRAAPDRFRGPGPYRTSGHPAHFDQFSQSISARAEVIVGQLDVQLVERTAQASDLVQVRDCVFMDFQGDGAAVVQAPDIGE